MIRLTLVDGPYLWAKPKHIVAISGYPEDKHATVQVGEHKYDVHEDAERIVYLMLSWHDAVQGVHTPEGTDATPSPLPLGPSGSV
jgi:uncharacterized protein YlzI (FlbEa/FlbD family)